MLLVIIRLLLGQKTQGTYLFLKTLVFVKKIKPFEEHYAFKQDRSISPLFGFTLTKELPLKAKIVDKMTLMIAPRITLDYFCLDNASEKGFSGAGLFNKEGEVVGVLQSVLTIGNYSFAIPAERILSFIKEYRECEKNEKEQTQEE